MFDELLTRRDISHLLLSDIQSMTATLEKEFPEVIKTFSIGKSWQEREILMISLDARDMMEKKGLQLTEHNKTFDTQMLIHKGDKKDDDDDGLTDVEMVDDAERKSREEKSKKQKSFEAVPESVKLDSMADALNLVQLSD